MLANRDSRRSGLPRARALRLAGSRPQTALMSPRSSAPRAALASRSAARRASSSNRGSALSSSARFGGRARGGTRRSRPARRALRACRASRRTPRGARPGSPSAASRRRRRGSEGGGSGMPPRRGRSAGRGGSAPCGRARGGGWRRRRARQLARLPHGPAVEDLPLDGARPIMSRSPGPSRSSLDCRRAWIVGGTTISSSPPFSLTVASISSMKSGFPSAACRILARASSVSCAPPASRESAARSPPSTAPRAGSSLHRACRRPAWPQLEQLRRAMQRRRIGASRDQSARCSTRSRKAARPTGCRRARGSAVDLPPAPRSACEMRAACLRVRCRSRRLVRPRSREGSRRAASR